MIVAISVVAIAGTVVTASGPHGGDAHAKRFSFLIPGGRGARHDRRGVPRAAAGHVRAAAPHPAGRPVEDQHHLAGADPRVRAATIGYIQYFNGIPALLVGFHIAATAVFAAVLHFYLHLTERAGPGQRARAGRAGLDPPRDPTRRPDDGNEASRRRGLLVVAVCVAAGLCVEASRRSRAAPRRHPDPLARLQAAAHGTLHGRFGTFTFHPDAPATLAVRARVRAGRRPPEVDGVGRVDVGVKDATCPSASVSW